MLRFENGLTLITQDNKYGVVDADGTEIIPCKYEDVYPIEHNNFVVKLGNLYGVLDKWGTEVIPMQYFLLGGVINDSMIAIASNNKVGLISTENKVMIPCIYDGIELLDVALVKARLEDRYGLYTLKGEEILSVKYKEDELDVILNRVNTGS